MTSKNAKSQALGVRGNQELSHPVSHRDRDEETQGDGGKQRDLSVGTSGKNCQRAYSSSSAGGTTAGGIINQLILKAEKQLVKIKGQIQQLQEEEAETKSELEDLRTLLAKLQK
nr:hypothetical protein [Okeania sp. SIO2C9]